MDASLPPPAPAFGPSVVARPAPTAGHPQHLCRDKGFDFAETKPDVGDRFDSRWGPSVVVERSDDPTTGTYLLLRIFPHGYEGKPGELGLERHDTPPELVGKV